MTTLAFIIKNACKRIQYQWFMSGVVVLCIALGMVIPIIILAMENEAMANSKYAEYQDMNHTAVLEYFASYQEDGKMDQQVVNIVKQEIKNIGYGANYQTNGNYKDQNFVLQFTGCSQKYLKMENYSVVSGRDITEQERESGEKVCLISRNATGVLAQVKAGDTITVMGTKFQVVGIVRVPKVYGNVFVDYKLLDQFAGVNMVQHTAIVETTEVPDIASIQKNMEKNSNIQTLQVLSAREQFEIYNNSIRSQFQKKMLMAGIVMVFSVISFVMVMLGKTTEELYTIGVKMSLGATKGQVFLDILFQNLVLIEMGILVDFGIYPIIAGRLSKGEAYLMDLKLILVVVGIGAILAVVISGLVAKIIFSRKNIMEIRSVV